MKPAVEVRLREGYPIFVGKGNLERLGETVKELTPARRVIVITNPTVGNLFGPIVRSSLENAGIASDLLEVPDGEEFKSLEVASGLYQRLVSINAHRYDPIVALGGGVIGDLAGFVAATYMRGVPLIQVPTTLLAQVDSSVGGKVAVNLPQGKNLVGCFYQPSLVYIDVSTLKSLPEREFRSGWAEVIKYGFIRDADFLAFIEANVDRILNLNEEILEKVVIRSCAIKAHFVELDEKDRGIRAHLNYGHTIGHALEAMSEYRKYLHGEAVSIGMVAAARISHYLGMLQRAEVERQERIISRLGLPRGLGGVKASRIKEQMEIDKKFTGQGTRFVLLRTIGEAIVVDNISEGAIDKVLLELGAEK